MFKRFHVAVALFAVPLLSGCQLPEDDLGIVRVVWNEFPWWSVVWRLLAWALAGAATGLLLGVTITILLRRWGAYRLPWPRTGFWLRVLIFTTNILVMP